MFAVYNLMGELIGEHLSENQAAWNAKVVCQPDIVIAPLASFVFKLWSGVDGMQCIKNGRYGSGLGVGAYFIVVRFPL